MNKRCFLPILTLFLPISQKLFVGETWSFRLSIPSTKLINSVHKRWGRPSTLEQVIGAKSAKIRKKVSFPLEKVIFDPNFEFSRENGTRICSYIGIFGAACKRGGKSVRLV